MPVALHRGDKGLRVLLLTRRLQTLGLLPRPYWHFTTKVAGAVKLFQAHHHLKMSGMVGSVTWTAIKHAAAAHGKPKPKPPASTVSTAAVNAIAGFEGGQSSDGLFHPYKDLVGVLTIGYGHTEGVTAHSKPLTKAQALELLHADLNHKYVPEVLSAARAYRWLPLTQNQLDALTSFGYNLGPEYFTPAHTLGAALEKRDLRAAAAAILLYDHAGGKSLPGLTRRRKWEHDLFLK